MKIQILKLTTVLLFMFSFYSCNDNAQKVEILMKENNKLRAELDSVRKLIPEYSYRAFILPQERIIKLGEEYRAYVGLAVVDKLNPPVSILDKNENQIQKDTLIYNPEIGMAEYKIKPTKTGTHKWYVEVHKMNSHDGIYTTYLAGTDYIVTK